MPRKKKDETPVTPEPAAEISLQPITETIEKNFMPYAMSVIVARAIPEIDGFKPSHRKLLYTMFKMGLLTGPRTKSANVVGQTMKLNPHGDGAIYETLVRLTRGNESLIHPFIDSKGSFGKHYSDMEYAASRYTEVKLDAICSEIFTGIERDAVDMTDNYDGTTKEPVLLPTSFPNILVSPNKGIAVAMSSSICSFNLAEVCDAAVQMLRVPETTVDQMLDILKAPDFQTGACIIYNREQLREIYRTGRGSVKLRARYVYDKNANCIEVLQIPYSTTIELIMKKLAVLVKDGRVKEITDFRDEIDLNGFKLTLDLRRGTDPDKLMEKLFAMTPLEDNFDCNFTVLIESIPKQLGICEILTEWIRFRIGCIKREFKYDLERRREKLHLLLGLGQILLDIDRAIKIVRETEKEKDVVPNLMSGFDIDDIQAEYIAEIRLRNLNREYILNRIKEIESLQKEIANLEDLIVNEKRQKDYIIKQLKEVKAKYGKPRLTQLIYDEDLPVYDAEDFVENYNVKLIFTRAGYFKKITLQSLRGNDEQKLKDGDSVIIEEDASNTDELLFFTDRTQVYKARVSDFDTVKASELGDYIAAKLDFDEGEHPVFMKGLSEYNEQHNFVFIFANGKGVRVPSTVYMTKTNRRKLTNAYSDVSPVRAVFYEDAPFDLLITSDAQRMIVIESTLIPLKVTRTSQGATLFTLKKDQSIITASRDLSAAANVKRVKKIKIPAVGVAAPKQD
ncbi:MAG: DNA topoisomerase (ATP-hydrolyzing) subunit A [Eubacteriales bacterium]|jgi:DNA gyrase subunit A|nr:DNA topoisomerase (ATP-hydrolyzing) subunit A [Eubacteriales bacterium]